MALMPKRAMDLMGASKTALWALVLPGRLGKTLGVVLEDRVATPGGPPFLGR